MLSHADGAKMVIKDALKNYKEKASQAAEQKGKKKGKTWKTDDREKSFGRRIEVRTILLLF